MQRALHLAIGAGISPFHQWTTPRSFHSSFPKLALLSKSRVYCCSSRESYRPSLRFLTSGSGSNGWCIASRMSAKGQDQSRADADAATSPSLVIPPIVHTSNISFCQSCGGPTKQAIPDGDEKLRAVCTVCSKIYYANPKMVVGCLVEHCSKVLLCKRNIEPSYGFWTLPAGYLEIGESAAEGAIRETLEEASAEVDVLSPFAQLDIPRIGQSYIIFRAKLKKPQFSPGPESLECALFGLDEIPFDTIAFSSIFVTLKLYIEDIKAGSFKFHYCTINKRPGASPSDPNGFSVDYQLHC